MLNVSLKEWDTQVKALESGRVAVLFRKGGIADQHGEFSFENKFWLYPTFLHQNAGELNSEFTGLLRDNPHIGTVQISSYATVQGCYKLEDLSVIRQLEPLNCLSADALERKFKYRHKPYVHAFLVRVYTVQPMPILETPEYAGCVSWVQLERGLDIKNPVLVLSDAAFTEIKTQLEGII